MKDGGNAARGTQIYRPVPGLVATAALWVATLVAVMLIARSGGIRAVWHVAPVLVAADALVWMAYWRPRVMIDERGVRLVDLLRTIDVPWPALRDLETRWTLKIVTDRGRYAAWAAPAPSAWATVRSRPGPGAHTGPASEVLNVAAEMVRYRWREHDNAPTDDGATADGVHVTWHRATIAVLAVLVVLAGLSVAVG